ncbi:MAG: hypothetical protein FJ224_08975 [Lentisphaerae bacterium]|nr:hypothetical protein [Lentisphaerota bacterium]
MRPEMEAVMVGAVISVCLLLLCAPGCSRKVAIDDVARIPATTPADEVFAGVFKPLEGMWQGRINHYDDPLGQKPGGVPPSTPDSFEGLVPRLIAGPAVMVAQKYTAVSPLFVRIETEETVTRDEGTMKLRYPGVCKVQDGRLWMVLRHPSETVVLEGEREADGVFVWRRVSFESGAAGAAVLKQVASPEGITVRGYFYGLNEDKSLAPVRWMRVKLGRGQPGAARGVR